jgi:hypothetical protein
MRQARLALTLILWTWTTAWTAPAFAAPLTAATAVIAYRPDGRLMQIPVTVAGVPLWFDFDSGARHTVIDAAVARRLHLTMARDERISGAGRGTVLMRHATPLDVTIGAIRLRIADPWVLDLSHVGTQRRSDGLVGADFLQAFVVRIDPRARTIAWYPPGRFHYHGAGASVPLTVRDGRFFVPMGLHLPQGVSVVRSVRIDTGSEDAVSDDLVRRSTVHRRSVQGVGLGKPFVDYSGLFSSVKIGPYRIYNVWGPSNDDPTVGMEVLRRFVLTFDAAAGRLYLEPTRLLTDPVPSPAPA